MLTKKRQLCASPESTYRIGDLQQFSVGLSESGHVLSISAGDILISRTLGNPLEGGLGRIYLRVHRDESVELHRLLGSNAELRAFAVEGNTAQWRGDVAGLLVRLNLRVDATEKMLLWDVDLEHTSDTEIKCDVVWIQDIGLAARGALLCNEAYVAQYLDATILHDIACGPVLCFRQNLSQGDGQYPWLMAACLSGARSYATDAFDVYGNGYRCGEDPVGLIGDTLSNRRFQYEFSCAALQSETQTLSSGDSGQVCFALSYVANHPAASSEKDLDQLKQMQAVSASQDALQLATTELPDPNFVESAASLHGRDLSRAEMADLFPSDWRHVETQDNALMSFFCDRDTHVVTRAKEALMERPHGSILVGEAGIESMRQVLAATVAMGGVFSAQTVYGNTSFHKMNSLPREPLGLSRAAGLRIYIAKGEGWQVLGTPSAFEMKLDACRWIYVVEGETINVQMAIEPGRDSLMLSIVTTGPSRPFIISNEVVMGATETDLNARMEVHESARLVTFVDEGKSLPSERGIELAFGMAWGSEAAVEEIGGSELLGAKGEGALVVLRTAATQAFSLRIAASLEGTSTVFQKLNAAAPTESSDYWNTFNHRLNCAQDGEAISCLNDVLRWYSHNALIHYASPHGLEQYSGAAWGTRDACQGPFEYFIAQQHHGLARSILLKTFGTQYEDNGDWPQWFMHDEYFDIAQHHSHGDIVVWPLKALALYLATTGDSEILDVALPYLTAENQKSDCAESLIKHVDKALDRIEQECIPGTALLRYGGGDWDDSLQPVNTDLSERLVSGWTVGLLAQTLSELKEILPDSDLNARVANLADKVDRDFRKYILVDGVVAGFLLFDESFSTAEPLLHPKDTRTGIHNRLIPMTRSILADLLTREEADLQMKRIADYLKHPDGVRLMDRPAPYQGGLETFFRRAESAANFGREIGLQYVHAHIRYAEALAKLGEAEAFLQALLTICPIEIKKAVANAEMRQANMYFSSSDAAFLDRVDAAENFDKLRDGSVSVKGGWRLYSSGPGLYTGLVLRQLFGLRERPDAWVFDPVMAKQLDGSVLTWQLCGRAVEIEFRVKHGCAGPASVDCSGNALPAAREVNQYRRGGLIVPKSVLAKALTYDSRLIVNL